MTPDPAGQYGIAVLDRMAGLVAVMVRLGPASLSRLASEAACHPATAFRILHTMRAHGLAAQDRPRGPWRLGVAWLSTARAAAAHGALMLAARPAMMALAASSNEAVYLAVRDGEEAEIAAIHRGQTPIRLYAKVGDRLPLHAGPQRLLLAYASPAVQQGALAAGRLTRVTPATRIEERWIRADLPMIRARGWLITYNEMAEGAVTITTGVLDAKGGAWAALTIASPLSRMQAPRPHAMLASLIAAAEAIRAAIGLV